MKKWMIPVLMMVFLGVLPASSVQYGVKAGLNVAGLEGDYTVDDYMVDLNSRNGFRIGGFCSFDIGKGLQLQPEFYYTQKGASYEYSDTYYTIAYSLSGNLKLDYIEIPVLVKYRTTLGALEPFFFAGPYLAFKASAKGDLTVEIAGFEAETESGDIEDVKSTDFGLVFGAGIQFPFGKVELILDVRYTLGLSNVSDVLDEQVKNGVFSIMVGVGL